MHPLGDPHARNDVQERPLDRGHKLPKLSWRKLLSPGSGTVLLGLFFGTLLLFVCVVLLFGRHP
jgi:hypothetical protein